MIGPEVRESKSGASTAFNSDSLPASVVIPTYNRIKSLIRTLKAIIAQKQLPREVVIVDDHSNDDTPNICTRLVEKFLPFRLVYIRQASNMGPAAARNIGVVNAQCDFILFTDDDCEPAPQWAHELLSALNISPLLAGVGGPVVSAQKSRIGLFFDHHKLLDPKFVEPDTHPLYLVTANAAFRKEWILKVGSFPEDLNRPGGEDASLSFRISASGGRLGFAPKAIVRHHYPSKYKSLIQMFWNYGYGGYYVSHPNPNFEQ